MISINMLWKADKIKGQGVLSAHDEQVNLVKNELLEYDIVENEMKFCNIMHYHTINPEYYFTIPFAKRRGKTIAYVHFVPETLEKSINLIEPFKTLFYKYVISFYKSVDHLVVVNPYFINVLEKYGINRKKITYIPNFVSSKNFYALDEERKNVVKEKYNLDKNKFTVLSVGQLQTRKGVLDFIEIARKIGTYDTSVLPYEDCCTVFLPKHPLIKPDLAKVEEAEKKLDIGALLEEALSSEEEVVFGK